MWSLIAFNYEPNGNSPSVLRICILMSLISAPTAARMVLLVPYIACIGVKEVLPT